MSCPVKEVVYVLPHRLGRQCLPSNLGLVHLSCFLARTKAVNTFSPSCCRIPKTLDPAPPDKLWCQCSFWAGPAETSASWEVLSGVGQLARLGPLALGGHWELQMQCSCCSPGAVQKAEAVFFASLEMLEQGAAQSRSAAH